VSERERESGKANAKGRRTGKGGSGPVRPLGRDGGGASLHLNKESRKKEERKKERKSAELIIR